MALSVQYIEATGQIVASVKTAFPPSDEDCAKNGTKQLILKDNVDVRGKRVNVVMQTLENCPKLARLDEREAIFRSLRDIDAKTLRALRDAALGDTTGIQKLEDDATALREQLAKLPEIN